MCWVSAERFDARILNFSVWPLVLVPVYSDNISGDKNRSLVKPIAVNLSRNCAPNWSGGENTHLTRVSNDANSLIWERKQFNLFTCGSFSESEMWANGKTMAGRGRKATFRPLSVFSCWRSLIFQTIIICPHKYRWFKETCTTRDS